MVQTLIKILCNIVLFEIVRKEILRHLVDKIDANYIRLSQSTTVN